MPIRVRNVVVNQVLDSVSNAEEDGDDKLRGLVTRLTNSQSSLIEEIHRNVDQLENPPRVTKVEPRGVYGLKALSEQRLVSSKQQIRHNYCTRYKLWPYRSEIALMSTYKSLDINHLECSHLTIYLCMLQCRQYQICI